ncbi:MAG TPA: inorganic diphosphatase [Candidatus Saccharimonadales bacterium]|nr:inorganic diphosphatase [Candidatus Saccharimonadales bacterium]
MSDVSYGDEAPDVVNVVIEIPRGTRRNKYEVDKDTGAIFLDRVNGVHVTFPYDYGYIPNTLCDDGDPLDALIVIDEPLFPGVVVPARPIGVFYMVDDGEKDEKLLCVAAKDVSKDHLTEIDQLGDEFKKALEHYFAHSKDWKNEWKGVSFKANGWGGAAAAKKVIQESIDRAK